VENKKKLEGISFRLQNLRVEPKEVIVRKLSTISIQFSLNQNLPKASRLIFRFRGGRNNKNDWYYLQPFTPDKEGYVKVTTNPSKKLLPLILTGKDLQLTYVICEEDGISKGTVIVLEISNTLVQSIVEDNKPIEILVQLPNNKLTTLEPFPIINVIHDEFDHITIICPSIVDENQEFKILFRIEDMYKNLVKNLSGKLTLFIKPINNEKEFVLEINFEKQNNGILFQDKLKISNTGIYVYIAEVNGKSFQSNPIICKSNGYGKKKLFWGYIHGHTNKSDGIRSVEEYFDNLIKAGLDFGTTTEHDHKWETLDGDFEEIKEKIKDIHKEKEFVSFFGYEWGYWYTGYGDICIYHYNDEIPILRSDINKYNSTKKLIKNLKPYEGKVLMIAHHTALRPGYRNWDYFDNSLEKLVEIYSTWGNQEYSYTQGNPLPPRYKFFGYGPSALKRGAILEKRESFVQDALNRGYKLGFVAGGDDHYGIYPSGSIDPDNGIYPSGIMAVWSEELTKKSLWDSLMDRHCYGTTGPRVLIEFYLEKYFMGDIIDSKDDNKLLDERNIKFRVISPLTIEKIELIRNNSIFKQKLITAEIIELEYQDNENFDEIALTHINNNEKFLFYYLRIFLEDNNMAWSSPIWIIRKL